MPRDMQLVAKQPEEVAAGVPVFVTIFAPNDANIADKSNDYAGVLERLIDLFQCHDEPEVGLVSTREVSNEEARAFAATLVEHPEGAELPDYPAPFLATIIRRKGSSHAA